MPLNSVVSEFIERITYAPSQLDSTDMEASTKTISATSEQAGADYSVALTVPAPTDTRLAVTRIGVQLNVTIDSFAGGGAVLNYRIKRDGTSIGTGTLSTGGLTGAKIIGVDVTAGTLTGAATYTVHLWVDAGTCVVSVCRIYAGVGMASGTPGLVPCMTLTFNGQVSIAASFRRQGTGNFQLYIGAGGALYQIATAIITQTDSLLGTNPANVGAIVNLGDLTFHVSSPTVATDLCIYTGLMLTLRSER